MVPERPERLVGAVRLVAEAPLAAASAAVGVALAEAAPLAGALAAAGAASAEEDPSAVALAAAEVEAVSAEAAGKVFQRPFHRKKGQVFTCPFFS